MRSRSYLLQMASAEAQNVLRQVSSWSEGVSGNLFSGLMDACHSKDICNLRATCKSWRDSFHDDLSALQLRGLPQRVSELEAFAASTPKVVHLFVQAGSQHITWQHMRAIATFRALNSLTLASSKAMTQKGLNQLSKLSNLQILDLTGTVGSLQLHSLTQLTSLSSLRLSPGSLGFATASPASVIPAVRFSQIGFLHLDLEQKKSRSSLCDITALTSVPRLSLKCCLKTDDKAFLEVLTAMPNVVYLNLNMPCQPQALATLQVTVCSSLMFLPWPAGL